MEGTIASIRLLSMDLCAFAGAAKNRQIAMAPQIVVTDLFIIAPL